MHRQIRSWQRLSPDHHGILKKILSGSIRSDQYLHAKGKYVVLHDGFELMAWKDFMQEEKYSNVILDTHQYLMVAEARGCSQTIEDI